MSVVDVAIKPKVTFEPEFNLGPFPDGPTALAALQAQGLAVGTEAIGFPSGRWWITQARDKSTKCGDCFTQTWSATGFCTPHLTARGYQLPTTGRA